MNKLINAMEPKVPQTNLTLTENLALTNKSTLNSVLDFFSKSGALRGNEQAFLALFIDAFKKDPLLAIRALFQARDIRGGNGERYNFRFTLQHLAYHEPDTVSKVMHLVPFYGRWDDLWVLLDTPLEDQLFTLIKRQIQEDISEMNENKPISLLAKWLPSENAGKESKKLAGKIRKGLEIKSKTYRKMLSKLRRHIDIVETKMSSGEWTGIDYSTVPSQAMRIYRNAFGRHDAEGFEAFLNRVEKGEVEIKASTLTPQQLVAHYLDGYNFAGKRLDRTIEAQWKALPNYMDDSNMIVIADTSGSMFWTTKEPGEVAVSLAIYASERNTGPFHGRWVNFSNRPTWQVLKGDSLLEKVANMDYDNWNNNTDLEAVFNMILQTGVQHSVPTEDMPQIVVVISDMQFDQGAGGLHFTTKEVIDAKYRRAGYEAPILVWWNVRASHGQPVTQDDLGNLMVSGRSQTAFKALMNADIETLKGMTPFDHMISVLNSERYSLIQL